MILWILWINPWILRTISGKTGLVVKKNWLYPIT
jgi:hypothetical protein